MTHQVISLNSCSCCTTGHCCVDMLLLLFICVLTVDGVPVNQTHGGPPGNVTSDWDVNVADLENAAELKSPQTADEPDADVYSSTIQQLMDARAETLADIELNDDSIEEGDILLQQDRNAVDYLWATTVIPIAISPRLADQQWKIHAALKMISDATCIRFKDHTNEVNYIRFQDGSGCASYVGRIGGGQPVFMSSECNVGNICHEVIHALGFHHEHTRHDRDQYIQVKWSNIRQKRKRHFRTKYGNTQHLPYDLNSIMHYGQYFFTKDGSLTLVSKVPGVQMGQRTHLSQLDMQRLNQLYCGQG